MYVKYVRLIWVIKQRADWKITSLLLLLLLLRGNVCIVGYHSKQSHLSSLERGVTVSALKMEK